MKYNFRIGDKVRIIGIHSMDSLKYSGKEGIIVSMDEKADPGTGTPECKGTAYVSMDNSARNACVWLSELEFVWCHTAPKESMKGYRYEPGDIILVSRKPYSWSSSDWREKGLTNGRNVIYPCGDEVEYPRNFTIKAIDYGKDHIPALTEDGFGLSLSDMIREGNIKLIAKVKQNNILEKIVNKINIMVKQLVDADTKLLVKAGLIDENLNPTCLGKEHSEAITFLANKAALVEVAKEIIAEKEEDCKK